MQRKARSGRFARQGNGTLPVDTTVNEFLQHWLSLAKSNVRPSTWEHYGLCVRRMAPLLGKIRLTSLSPSQIRLMEDTLLNEKGLAGRTVRHCHAVLHNALNEAVRQNLLDRNPTSDVTAPRVVRKELRTLSRDQVKQLLSVSEGGRWHALWGLLVTTGMRLGEACALRWNDVDFMRGVATVQRSVQRQKGKGLLFVEPKTTGSRRAIRLPQGTVDMLKAHWDVVEHIRGSAGEPWREQSLIFPALTGGPLDPSRVNTALHNDLHRAGLPRLRVHDLRHTAATLLLEEGTHPKVVQDLLGHSTIAMTLDLYSHVTPRLQEEATARMQELLFDARHSAKSRRQQKRKH